MSACVQPRPHSNLIQTTVLWRNTRLQCIFTSHCYYGLPVGLTAHSLPRSTHYFSTHLSPQLKRYLVSTVIKALVWNHQTLKHAIFSSCNAFRRLKTKLCRSRWDVTDTFQKASMLVLLAIRKVSRKWCLHPKGRPHSSKCADCESNSICPLNSARFAQ